MRKFRYTGTQPVVFQPPVGPCAPGDEFAVPDAVADRFAQHGDVDELTAVSDGEPRPPKSRKNQPASAE